ncbi:MAG: hypothetical protein CL824_04610 [Crocinitomicaceae bacterium]|nr:hypothetical protein [Crocinitomicaceae bacterium]
MKYNLTSKWGVFVYFCLFFISITSQSSLKVQISGDTASYSGGTYQFTAPSKQDFYLNIEAHNISATDTFLLYVTCVELNTLNGWADGFCWAASNDPINGQCYSSGQIDSSFWTSPHSMLIDTNEYGALKLDLYPDTNFFGQSHYRYLFGVMQNGSLNQIDSIDILIDYFASTSDFENSSSSISIFPNPANNYISIISDLNDPYRLDFFDVMGNKINSSTINSSSIIDLTTYKNGAYFVKAYCSDGTIITKKLLIKH